LRCIFFQMLKMCLGRPATSARIPASRKRLAQFALGILDETLARAALLVQQLRDALVGIRLQEAEGQVFQLPLELPDAEPIRERRVDVGAELGEFAPFRFRQARRGAHPHQLARQQDQHHAQIPDDRQQQAAQPFGVVARARRAALRMQRPDLLGFALAVEQGRERRRQQGRRERLSARNRQIDKAAAACVSTSARNSARTCSVPRVSVASSAGNGACPRSAQASSSAGSCAPLGELRHSVRVEAMDSVGFTSGTIKQNAGDRLRRPSGRVARGG
jgi:hypothetical protein